MRGDQESKGANCLNSKRLRIELTINRKSKQYGSALCNQNVLYYQHVSFVADLYAYYTTALTIEKKNIYFEKKMSIIKFNFQ